MKNIILFLTTLFLITNCVSKQPSQYLIDDIEIETRKPSGFFDVFKDKPKGITLMKCANCNAPNSEPGTVQIEMEKYCPSDRLYYQAAFKKIPDIFKIKRTAFPEAQFPEACMVHVMRSTGSHDSNSPHLTRCASEDSAPMREKLSSDDLKDLKDDGKCQTSEQMKSIECTSKIKGNKLACVTSEYVYSTYNAYVDVMDCLQIPQRELLPKLWNESQFHVNMYGKGSDAGVGQLTGDAIQEVVKKKYAEEGNNTLEIEYYKNEMRKAQKPSCDRILAEANAWKVVEANLGVRCGVMMPESSPLRNILYTGIFYRVITSKITGIFYRAGKEYIRTPEGFVERNQNENQPLGGAIKDRDFIGKLASIGIQNPNMEYLKQVLVSLAFNAGSRGSVDLFDNFLKTKIANNQKITEADLDFVNADSMKDAKLIIGPKNETDDAKQIRLEQLKETRQSSFDRNLPQFLRLMQDSGSPGYVSKIAYRNKMLNNDIGDGVCTQPLFLQHSSVQPQPGE